MGLSELGNGGSDLQIIQATIAGLQDWPKYPPISSAEGSCHLVRGLTVE
jgi:hypothetical protein